MFQIGDRVIRIGWELNEGYLIIGKTPYEYAVLANNGSYITRELCINYNIDQQYLGQQCWFFRAETIALSNRCLRCQKFFPYLYPMTLVKCWECELYV